MLKKFLLSIFIVGIFFLPQISNAQPGCCIVTIPAKSTGTFTLSFQYGAPTKPVFNPNLNPTECRKQSTVCTSKSCTSIKQAFYVQNDQTHCSSIDQAQKTYGATWCCTEERPYIFGLANYVNKSQEGKLDCTAIPNGNKCSTSKQVLYQRTCHAVAACTQSAQLLKDHQTNAKLLEQEYERLTKEIKRDQIKPSLGTTLPGFPGFSDITVTKLTENGKIKQGEVGIRYIRIEWIAQIIKWLYGYAIGIAGLVAVIMLMFGGFTWILSGGDPSRVSSAKEYIKSAILGLILVMTSYAILNFVNPNLVNPDALYIEVPSAGVNTGDFPQCRINFFKEKKLHTIDGAQYCDNFEDKTKFVNLRDPAIAKQIPKIKPPGGKNIAYVTNSMFKKLKKINDSVLQKGETIAISNTSRSLNTQVKVCNCWETFKSTNFNTCPSGCGACNFAPGPACGSGGHRRASAADLTLTGTNTKIGKLACGAKSMKNNCGEWIKNAQALSIVKKYKGCEPTKDKAGKVVSKHPATLCQNRLKEIMNKGGAKEIGNEWWHFEF